MGSFKLNRGAGSYSAHSRPRGGQEARTPDLIRGTGKEKCPPSRDRGPSVRIPAKPAHALVQADGFAGRSRGRFGRRVTSVRCVNERRRELEHDPEKWEPVFGKDHAQTIS